MNPESLYPPMSPTPRAERKRYIVETTDGYRHTVNGTSGFKIEDDLLMIYNAEHLLTAFPVANVRSMTEKPNS
jgi:hypothetical protein